MVSPGSRSFGGGTLLLKPLLLPLLVLLLAPAVRTTADGPPDAAWARLDTAHRMAEVVHQPPGEPGEALWLRQTATGRLHEPGQSLPPGRGVDLRIVSARTGKPVQQARLWTGPSIPDLPPLDGSLVTTDERGRARVVLGPGDWLRVWAPSFRSLLRPGDGLASGDLVLQDGGEVELVFGGAPDGEPVRFSYRWSGDPEGAWLDAAVASGEPFHAVGLSADRPLEVRLTDPRFRFFSADLEPGTHRRELEEGHSLAGRVVDREGRPVEDVEVEVLLPVEDHLARRWRRTARTDAEGRFELGGMPKGRFLVTWTHPELRREQRWMGTADTGDPPTLTLNPGRTLEVRVIDAEGPLEGASVIDSATQLRTPTDGEGLASLPGLPVDRAAEIRVEAEDHLPEEITVAPGAASPLEVRLRRGQGLRVELRDLWTGEAVDRIRTETVGGGLRTFDEHTSPDGTYLLSGFPDGALRVTLRPPGYLPVELDLGSGRAGVAAGGTGTGIAELGTLYLDPGTTVEGLLLDGAGTPLAGALLTVPVEHSLGSQAVALLQPPPEIEADAEGRFRVTESRNR